VQASPTSVGYPFISVAVIAARSPVLLGPIAEQRDGFGELVAGRREVVINPRRDNWNDIGCRIRLGPLQTVMFIENILSSVPPTTRAWFDHPSVGAEIGLVVETAPNEQWAIEIMRSLGDPKPSRGFYIGCEDIMAGAPDRARPRG
jgi:hypothetical protein